MKNNDMKNIAIFCSGNGTNADNIIKKFEHSNINVSFILCNKLDIGAYDVAEKHDIKFITLSNEQIKSKRLQHILKVHLIDYIVLAGFLRKIPEDIIKMYPNRIFNIHPSLLPKYGGKSMYGNNVHKAVMDNKEMESGITIHYIDGEYDKGETIFQAKCAISNTDTVENLVNKIKNLEKKYYPTIIEQEINKN